MFKIIILPLFIVFSFSCKAGDLSFSKAKKHLLKIYKNRYYQTFYCGCTFNRNRVDQKSCSFSTKKYKKRGKRIEWEHIVPAHRFGGKLPEWKNPKKFCKKGSGRKCSRKKNKIFRMMEADMHNLVPAIGSINAVRSNHKFGVIKGEKRVFGNCDFEDKAKLSEPRPAVRGDIARAYFYMQKHYRMPLVSNREMELFYSWDKQDPPDAWECKREKLISAIQGTSNSYIRKRCK